MEAARYNDCGQVEASDAEQQFAVGERIGFYQRDDRRLDFKRVHSLKRDGTETG